MTTRSVFDSGRVEAAMKAIADGIPKLPRIAPEPEPLSKTVLERATAVIHGERAEAYGSAEESFARIAGYWSTHLGVPVSAHDVAIMMVLMKAARAKSDKGLDTYIDIAGYAALAPRLHE